MRPLVVVALLPLVLAGLTPASAAGSTGSQLRPQANGHPSADAWGELALTSAVATARTTGPRATPAKVRRKVVGKGTARSCTFARLAKAVRSGGNISFDCGPGPVTIKVKRPLVTCNTHSCEHAWRGGKRVPRMRLDGGGKVTLSGGGKHGIFYASTCDAKLGWIDARCDTQTTPHIVFRNITFTRGDSSDGPAGYEGVLGGGGGGAIAMRGGRLTVRDATFTKNRCTKRHPDAGGGAIRVTGQRKPARIVRSTFRGNRCANGGAVSSLQAPLRIKGSTFAKNRATGRGASSGRGGNGGAIYFDGTNQDVRVVGSTIRRNRAPEGGPGIFYVSNDRTGKLVVERSRIVKNRGARFWTGRTQSIFFLGKAFTHKASKIH